MLSLGVSLLLMGSRSEFDVCLLVLQRLAEDSNPAIAAAASNAIKELKKQWEIGEGDSWSFTVNQKATMEGNEADDDEDDANPL